MDQGDHRCRRAVRAVEAAIEVPGPDGHALVVRPGVAPASTRLSGTEVTLNFSTRLARILDKKGARPWGARIALIWIEDCGGIHALHPFTRMPLPAKINGFAALASDARADRPHVAGIAWSGAARRMEPPPDDQAETEAGNFFQGDAPVTGRLPKRFPGTVPVCRGLKNRLHCRVRIVTSHARHPVRCGAVRREGLAVHELPPA